MINDLKYSSFLSCIQTDQGNIWFLRHTEFHEHFPRHGISGSLVNNANNNNANNANNTNNNNNNNDNNNNSYNNDDNNNNNQYQFR